MSPTHAMDVRAGIRIEMLSIVWMVIEAVVSIGTGIVAGSILLTLFGIDSVIELVSAGILLRRLAVDATGGDGDRAARAERHAARVVGVALALLCVYVLASATYGLVMHTKPEGSPVGVGMAVVAVLVMPWLALTKRRIAARLDSGALRGDVASSLTCGYMAGTVLVGLALNALFHWWWAEDIAALVFLFWLVQETCEALEEAHGEGADDD